MQMIDAARDGRMNALWAIGYDVALTNPAANATVKALQSLQLVVVQDLFLTETARLAGTVFLPAASSFEKDGTFMNSERRIQLVRQAIDPPGMCKPDWQIIGEVAAALGYHDGFQFRNAEEIWNEVRSVWLAGAGITYERLKVGGLQWPCPNVSHAGTPILHIGIFESDHRTALRCIQSHHPAEQVSAEYPMLLTTGRSLYQFNAATMTMRSQIAPLRPTDTLSIHPDDARRLNIANHQLVRLISRHGEATIQAEFSTSVRPGDLFATFHSPNVFLNRVVSDVRDRFVGTPQYKVTAVRVDGK